VAVGNTAKLSDIFVGGGSTCFPVASVCLVLTLKMVLSFALPCKDRVEEVNALTPKKCGMWTRRRDPFECPDRNLRNSARGRGKTRPCCLLDSHTQKPQEPTLEVQLLSTLYIIAYCTAIRTSKFRTPVRCSCLDWHCPLHQCCKPCARPKLASSMPDKPIWSKAVTPDRHSAFPRSV
jgi:hypothetical protein